MVGFGKRHNINVAISRFFCGVASSPKQQRVLVESWFNDCLKVNPGDFIVLV